MADTTAIYGWPYQEATDPPDGAGLGQDLAEAIEGTVDSIDDRVDVVEAKLTATYTFLQQVRFTASGTFTKASYPTARLARVRVVGGGGGGGGAATNAAANVSAGGGGQGGGYAESLVLISAMATNETVTVGTGGAGGVGLTGSAGNNSSFGSLVTAQGGVAGSGGATGATAFSTAGGGTTLTMVGDLTIGGQAGGMGARLGSTAGQSFAGVGGSSHMGGGGFGGRNNNGANGAGYGGGGGGASNDPSLSAKTGGTGANGIVIVDLYA